MHCFLISSKYACSFHHTDLFCGLDNHSDQGIINYGVTMTSLEDVFLKLEGEEAIAEGKIVGLIIPFSTMPRRTGLLIIFSDSPIFASREVLHVLGFSTSGVPNLLQVTLLPVLY